MARFRKGKKAFKANRRGKFYDRYRTFLINNDNKRRALIKAAQMSMVAFMGIHRIKQISVMPGIAPHEKTISIAESVIDIHSSMAKILNQ